MFLPSTETVAEKEPGDGLDVLLVVGVVEDLHRAVDLVGHALDGLHCAGLVEDVGGRVGVQEGHELLGLIDVLGLLRDPSGLNGGVDVAGAAFLGGRHGREAPLEAVGARGILHFVDDPGAVRHEQGLAVKHGLLVLGEVLAVGVAHGVRVQVLGDELLDEAQGLLGLRGLPDVLLVGHHVGVELLATDIGQQGVRKASK